MLSAPVPGRAAGFTNAAGGTRPWQPSRRLDSSLLTPSLPLVPDADDRPTFEDIVAVARRIEGAVMETPFLPSRTLSAIAGCDLRLKFENLQFTASFKERGALAKLLSISREQLAAGVVAMSAGNHAQGVAYHAKRLGVAATIVMPEGTPLTKIARTRDHGAEVVVTGANLTEALEVARKLETERSLSFVHPYDDAQVIAGQGTVAIEILGADPDLDTIVVPIGGGGLISGIAIAARALKPGIRIVGVQSRTYPSMARALAGADDPCPDSLTIAEGIAVKTAGMLTRTIVAELVDDILLVEEASIERAIALLMSIEKTVVEGAGAVGLAAILEHPSQFAGKRVATILSGGNIDLRVLASVAMRDLVRHNQLISFAVSIADQPGGIARLTALIAGAKANVLDIGHDRLSLALNAKGAEVRIITEVQSGEHGEAVLEVLRINGFAVVRLG